MRVVWVMCLVAGCGRIGFDAAGDDGGTVAAECPAFAMFCDDFEAGDLHKWSETLNFGAATGQVATTRAHAGAFAYEAMMGPSGQVGTSSPALAIGTQTAGVIAVRAWVSFAIPIRNFDLVMEVRNDANDEFTAVGADDTGSWVASEARVGQGQVIDHTTTIAAPGVGTWTCVELVYTYAATGNQVEVFADDVRVLAATSITPSPSYDHVGVGIVRADQTGFHAFTDDVVIANRRIGCP